MFFLFWEVFPLNFAQKKSLLEDEISFLGFRPKFQGPVCYVSFRLLPCHVFSPCFDGPGALKIETLSWHSDLVEKQKLWKPHEEQWSFHPGWSPRSPMTSIFEGQIPQNKAFYTKQNTGNLGHFEGWSKHTVDGIRLTSWYGESTITYKGFYLFQVVNRISSINSIKTPW